LANIINGTDTGSGGLITTGDSSDELQIQTAETTAITINSSQNVGIGTNAPTGAGRILHINNSGTDGADVCDLRFTTGTTGATSGDGVRIRLANVGDLDINNLEANSVLISTQNTERMRVTSDGYLRMAGAGIQFNGDTAAANALDDYEEGTFDPTIIGSSTAGTVTYNTRFGSYTKIGRQVSVIIYVNWSSGNGTGNLQISNFPFTSRNDSGYPPGATYLSDVAYTSGGTVSLRLDANSTTATFVQSFYNTGGTAVAYDGAGAAFVQLTYFV
jgi:hypothetical protein